jgi:hypothetical protein
VSALKIGFIGSLLLFLVIDKVKSKSLKNRYNETFIAAIYHPSQMAKVNRSGVRSRGSNLSAAAAKISTAHAGIRIHSNVKKIALVTARPGARHA